jgi:hypothetical protein
MQPQLQEERATKETLAGKKQRLDLESDPLKPSGGDW